ncbi:MAG: gfo/Idh/MocA family oxidoreductase, partial [Chloroflexi bacterium]
MNRIVHIGMLGSGFVADFYMDGLRDVPGTEVVANYSRSEERAREFGRKYDVPRQYT